MSFLGYKEFYGPDWISYLGGFMWLENVHNLPESSQRWKLEQEIRKGIERDGLSPGEAIDWMEEMFKKAQGYFKACKN
jgi:hypothetical protein